MNIKIESHKALLFLLIIFSILLCGNIATIYLHYGRGFDYIKGFITTFDFESEGNVPTWFSSILLLLNSFLFLVIAVAKIKYNDRYKYHWLFLVCLFGYISVDETACIHEKIGVMLGQFLSFKGYPCYAWVFPAMFIVLTIGIFYFKFYFDLQKSVRRLFSSAVVLYLAGGLGMEIVGGRYSHCYGQKTALYALIGTAEESLEMIGVIILIYALLVYVKDLVGTVTVEL